MLGPPTLHGSIELKTVAKLLTALFLISIREKIQHAANKCDAISGGCTSVKRQEIGVFISSIFGQTLSINSENINSSLL
jgi:hypothetical protein